MKKVPERRCIACNNSKPKKELLRIVKNKENEVSVDLTGKKAGRGAYVCNNIECLEKLKKSGILNKTFEIQVDDNIYEIVRDVIENKSK